MSEKEIEELDAKIIILKEQNDLGELALSYSILADICKLKAIQALEEGGDINFDELKNWKIKSAKYKQLEKETLLKLGKVIIEFDADFIVLKPEIIKAIDEEAKRKNITRDTFVKHLIEIGIKKLYDDGLI